MHTFSLTGFGNIHWKKKKITLLDQIVKPLTSPFVQQVPCNETAV